MTRGFSSADDASDFFAGFGIRFRMSVDHKQNYVAHHADRLPSRLAGKWIAT